MKDVFLEITNHDELAAFFKLNYEELSKILYKYPTSYKYTSFEIPKKNGGTRQIKSPCKKLKKIQSMLKDVLYEIYPGRPSAFGFVKNRNIVDNSEKHLDKKYILNIDLKDFFVSIYFGRIKRLFMAKPFKFNSSISTILAQICCIDNSLPQGAPTSPILSNMIAWKLDAQLQKIAKLNNSTYTRYADDITFSFSCNKRALPSDLVSIKDNELQLGHKLVNTIEANGFEINMKKVRLAGVGQRMEVTGITVNKFPNVTRKYVRQISSLLHSWRKFGYDATSTELNTNYYKKHRASGKGVALEYYLKGKLSFLRSVRGHRDLIFNKLAIQYNHLVNKDFTGNMINFSIFEIAEPEVNAVNALWVVEICYDDDNGELVVGQGTAFSLKDVGIVTCAHVISENGSIFKNINAFKCTNTSKKYELKVIQADFHRDIAICDFDAPDSTDHSHAVIEMSDLPLSHGMEVKLIGFPAYKTGQTHYVCESKVATTYTESLVEKFEIDKTIRKGNSGGPIIDSDGKLLGVALKGASQDFGKDAALFVTELSKMIGSTD